MNYGLNLAASGAMTSLYRMDVLSNNLANISTPGFKADVPAIQQRDAERIEDRLPFLPSNRMLEALGGGVFAAANRVGFEQGAPNQTGNPLDLALQGDGFFVLQDESDRGREALRLTRDGRFTRDSGGRLVSSTSGLPVLDASNSPITVADTSPVQILRDGTVMQAGEEVARIQIMSVAAQESLVKVGRSMFKPTAAQLASAQPGSASVLQRYVEGSSVDPVLAMTEMMRAQRTVEANASMLQTHDRLSDRAINGLGRVA